MNTTTKSIIDMAQGAIKERADYEMARILDNIMDPNTAPTKKRTLTLQPDDGISQKVTARSGVSLVASAKVPNPITLRPYRTFSEVEQPESTFVFRVKAEERSGVTMALFEADGSAWKHTAIVAIRDFLKKSLDKQEVIILA